jgi:hypothetical protein
MFDLDAVLQQVVANALRRIRVNHRAIRTQLDVG